MAKTPTALPAGQAAALPNAYSPQAVQTLAVQAAAWAHREFSHLVALVNIQPDEWPDQDSEAFDLATLAKEEAARILQAAQQGHSPHETNNMLLRLASMATATLRLYSPGPSTFVGLRLKDFANRILAVAELLDCTAMLQEGA